MPSRDFCSPEEFAPRGKRMPESHAVRRVRADHVGRRLQKSQGMRGKGFRSGEWRAAFALASLVVLTVILAAMPAAAAPSRIASGTISPVSSLGEVLRVADGKTFFHHTDGHVLEGTFTGTVTEDATIMVDPATGKGVASGFSVFTGGVNGMTGTIVFHIYGTVSLPGAQGQWVIYGGTGGLVNLRGQGTWSFANLFEEGSYTGEIHFDP